MAGLIALTLLTCACHASTEVEGLSRTSWGRFAWWESDAQQAATDNIDGMLAYNVTLNGLAGVIQLREGLAWDPRRPREPEPLEGSYRLWRLRLDVPRRDPGARPVEYRSVKPRKTSEAPAYVRKFNWIAKWIDLYDYEMTYSLASALVRVKPRGMGIRLSFDDPVRYAAYVNSAGVQIVYPRDGVLYDDKRDGELSENWVLLWHGEKSADNQDIPFLLVLHGRPSKISVDDRTVTVSTRKGRRSSVDLGPPFGLRRFLGSETEKWVRGLPNDILTGCRFWSRAGLAYPIGCREYYNVDQDTESVKITDKYEYEIVRDDWHTEPLKLAPFPPLLACVLDAGYPGKLLTARTDPGFVTYYGPFAAAVGTDTAQFELPIPIEDSFAALETPGSEAGMDSLTRATATVFQRWSKKDWTEMGSPYMSSSTEARPVMSFDEARERALMGKYPVIGIPDGHEPGELLPDAERFPHWNSFFVPSPLVVDERVRPGVIGAVNYMAEDLDRHTEDEFFESGMWRVEVEPTCKMPMTYVANVRAKNLPDRVNGDTPYDITCAALGAISGYFDGGLWAGRWDLVRKNWHKILQVSDSVWRNHDWATSACDDKDSRPSSAIDLTWDHSAGLDCLARCAYGIGDRETYDFLCYLRARIALVSTGMEAVQQYLQPVLLWQDNTFVGHLGEPYPPFWTGITPMRGAVTDWDVPYPPDAFNDVTWRFNNANIPCVTAPLRWTAMAMPETTRWFLDRADRYLPHAYDGERYCRFAGSDKPAPPYFAADAQLAVAVNHAALGYFLGDPAVETRERLDRISHIPAVAPWNVEIGTVTWGRGAIQQILAADRCPMWASAWEPRLIWEGRYNPRTGIATLIVEPGDAPLRFKGTSGIPPISVSANGLVVQSCPSLKEARTEGGWYYDKTRQTIHVHCRETGRIELEIGFPPDPSAPSPLPRMVAEKPEQDAGVNLLTNGGFDLQVADGMDSRYVGDPTGPYLYVGRWIAEGSYWTGGAFGRRDFDLVGSPTRSTGLALSICASKESSLSQNVAAVQGRYRLICYIRTGQEWNSQEASLSLSLKALQVGQGRIDVLKTETSVIQPESAAGTAWARAVIEIDAPGGTNAVQVGLNFQPLQDTAASIGKCPVYIDDMELTRLKG